MYQMSVARRPAPWVARLYYVPDDMKSLQDWNRRRHYDLADMDVDELWAELRCCRRRADYDADPWLVERLAAIRAAIRQIQPPPPPNGSTPPRRSPSTPPAPPTPVASVRQADIRETL